MTLSNEEPRILTPQQATEWEIPSDPQISPDGTRIAYVVTPISQTDEHRRSTIWMSTVDGIQNRPFTAGSFADSQPRWSPDGQQLVFVSDRREAGKGQVYVIPAGGGEARSPTEWKGEVSEPRWSPDGTLIAFVGTDPETPEEEQRKKDRRDEIVADTQYKYGRLYVVSPEGGEPQRIGPEEDAHVAAFDWSPDGQALLALLVRTPTADDRFYGPSRLVRCAVTGETEPCTVLEVPYGMDQPLYSPDGQYIAFRGSMGRVQTHDQIFVVSASGGEPRCLTAGYEGSIFDITWAPDSSAIRFMAVQDLWGVLSEVDRHSGQIRPLLPDEPADGTFLGGVSFSRDGRQFAVVRSSSDAPTQVWSGTVGERLQQVSKLHANVQDVPFVRAEMLQWQSRDGMTISGLLYRPPDFQPDQKYPLILHIHGGPASFWSDRFMGDWHDWDQLLAMRGYLVLAPNPRGSIGRGQGFTDAEACDMGGGELHDVLAGVDHVIGMGIVDPERLGVGGWSHGGYMTAWTITQTDRFKAAVMGAGLSDLVSDQGESDIPRFNDEYFPQTVYENASIYWQRSPLAYLREVRTPTLILHGEKDDRVDPRQGQEMYRGLKRMGVETQFVLYPREPHSFKERAHQIDLLERVIAWYDRFLQPGREE